MSMRWNLLGWLPAAVFGVGVAVAAEGPPCGVCHADTADARHRHPMADAIPGAPACTDCHRDAAAHPPSPGGAEDVMMRFEAETAEARSAACLGCHDDVHQDVAGDVHRRSGMACNDCHQVHDVDETARARLPAGFERIDPASALCAGCHASVLTQFAFNERHRLAEGSVACISCHDPHRSSRRPMLHHPGDDACGACHDDKTGPFVFEHAASRVDGCTACHEPHGTPNRHLLSHQREGELCYTCHTSVPQFHVGFAPGAPPRFDERTVCTNCHTMIHGSNFDRNFLR